MCSAGERQMLGRRACTGLVCAGLAVTLSECTPQAPTDLAAALKGIEKSRFLSCSGPPILQLPQGNQDRMSFVTNLKRGSTIGIASPTAIAPEACSVDAVFQDDRLASANFSGNLAMCNLVFGPCLRK
jgi:hypothetical protein